MCSRHKPRPRRFRGAHSDDRGSAQFIEVGALALLAAAIFGAVLEVKPQDGMNKAVREMVCLVEGPKCDGPTWTEHDRPDEPEEYAADVGGLGGRAGDNEKNKEIGKKIAAERGFTGREWDCLETLWSHESNWDHTAVNPSGGASGIPQLHPAAHTPPPGFMDSAELQIEWGLDYIENRYKTPCAAWSFWQNPSPQQPGFSDNWY